MRTIIISLSNTCAYTGLLSDSYANRSTDHDDVDDENVGSTTTNNRGTPTYLPYIHFMFCSVPLSGHSNLHFYPEPYV